MTFQKSFRVYIKKPGADTKFSLKVKQGIKVGFIAKLIAKIMALKAETKIGLATKTKVEVTAFKPFKVRGFILFQSLLI